MTQLSDLNREQQNHVMAVVARAWPRGAYAFGITDAGQHCKCCGAIEATTAPDDTRGRLWAHARHVVEAHTVALVAGVELDNTVPPAKAKAAR